MAAEGEIPAPAFAIFADTGAEPASVYRWLDWLEARLPYPVVRVSRGSIRQEIVDAAAGVRKAHTRPPFFVRNADGSIGMTRRQCTQNYKIEPIRAGVRAVLELGRRGRVRRGVMVRQYIGISLDEAVRMKPSGVSWITNEYPLIDRRMTRGDCIKWMEARGYPRPPKSACTFCPYRSDAEWLRMKEEEPEAFADAVAIDGLLRGGIAGLRGDVFVHRSCVPLAQVNFRPRAPRMFQPDLFGNECEGMCGV
jgi:hypothetical protein